LIESTGGWTPSINPVPTQLKDVTISFKSDAEKIIGHIFHEFLPLSYHSQVVAGTRYLVLVQISKGFLFTINVEIFEDLQGQFHFVNAYPLYTLGQKVLSHALQHTEYTPAQPEEDSSTTVGSKISAFFKDTLHLGPGPVKPPTVPLGPGPVIPSGPIIPISGWKTATKEVIAIAEKEKAAAEALLKTTFKIFTPAEFALTHSLEYETFFIVVETSELDFRVLGEPKSIKFYTELTVNHYYLSRESKLVNAAALPNGLPQNPRIETPNQGVGSGSGGQIQGPFTITTQLAEAAISFKTQTEEYTGVKYTKFVPKTFYHQVVAGTLYYVYVQTGDLLGSYIIVEFFLGLTPASKYQFVRASTFI